MMPGLRVAAFQCAFPRRGTVAKGTFLRSMTFFGWAKIAPRCNQNSPSTPRELASCSASSQLQEFFWWWDWGALRLSRLVMP
jgi:hypothetical protein